MRHHLSPLLLLKRGPSPTQFIEKNTALLGDYNSFARITQHKAVWPGDGQARIPTPVTSTPLPSLTNKNGKNSEFRSGSGRTLAGLNLS